MTERYKSGCLIGIDRGLSFPLPGRSKRKVHPAGNAAVVRWWAATGAGLRRALQQRPSEQRRRLHHAEGHAGWAAAGDPRGARREAGSSGRLVASRLLEARTASFRVGVRRVNFRFGDDPRGAVPIAGARAFAGTNTVRRATTSVVAAQAIAVSSS